MFADRVEIEVRAGRGGHGALAFRREKYVPKGGPSGGDGGRGGSVVFEVDGSLVSLDHLRAGKVYRAGSGGDGEGSLRHGRDADDLVLLVPAGTVIIDAVTGRLLGDLVSEGERFVAAHAGRGGRGNARFASAVNRAPRISERGEPGETMRALLELRLIADIGLVGMPNAGKSSILREATCAPAKIGAYPFTTLQPSLGVLQDGERRIILADLPGLVEGAHEGRGLGLAFLRHAVRTRALVQVVDVSGSEGRQAVDDLEAVDAELVAYDPDLAVRPRILAANKMDLPSSEAGLVAVKAWAARRGWAVIACSAVTGEGFRELTDALFHLAEDAPAPVRSEIPEERIVLGEKGFVVEVERPHKFRVTGPAVTKRVAMTDTSQPEAAERLGRYFIRQGIEAEIRRLGGRDGDVVQVGELEFILEPALGMDAQPDPKGRGR